MGDYSSAQILRDVLNGDWRSYLIVRGQAKSRDITPAAATDLWSVLDKVDLQLVNQGILTDGAGHVVLKAVRDESAWDMGPEGIPKINWFAQEICCPWPAILAQARNASRESGLFQRIARTREVIQYFPARFTDSQDAYNLADALGLKKEGIDFEVIWQGV